MDDRSGSALLSCLVALALLVGIFSAGSAPRAQAEEVELPPGGSFLDDDMMPEEGFIEAIAAAGITLGCNPPANDRYCPKGTVTRGQMASFLVRALDLPAPEIVNRFSDDDDSVHQPDIDRLASAGITLGCNPPANDNYCPDRTVTRGEMAAFLVRAFGYPAADVPDRFRDDDDSMFAGEIDRLASAGITNGCNPPDDDNYCPDEPMLRRHLAVFLARALDLDPIVPPPRPRRIARYTTNHSCCQSRVTNIHLIADTVDGAVVPPGETFSINGYVGRRTTAKGYVAAGAIVGGELVCCDHPDNIGGGTSQFATTLYNAVYFAGLEDVSHKPHSIYFSRYPLGHEATLGWTSPDLVFRNDTPYPVTIETSYTSRSITVELWGYTGSRSVESSVTGSATTSGGGTVTATRTVTYEDGSVVTRSWTHTYKALPPSNDPPPPPPPPEEEPEPPPLPLPTPGSGPY